MDRFDTMRAFVRVVEAGSFTKAAATLHMSRTTVTQLVQQLEARLQLKLLHRTTRKVNVTEDGALYYERLVQLLDQIDDVESGLPGASARPQGQLRVDVPSPLATLILMPALPQFHAKYPDIQLELGASDRKVDLIEDRVDCVVRGGEMTDQALAVRQIGQLAPGVYAAPAYLERHGIPAHPEELQDQSIGSCATGGAVAATFLLQCGGSKSASRFKATMWSPPTTATLTWLPALPAWASCGFPITWRWPRWRRALWYACSQTGRWSPCPCISPIRQTGI